MLVCIELNPGKLLSYISSFSSDGTIEHDRACQSVVIGVEHPLLFVFSIGDEFGLDDLGVEIVVEPAEDVIGECNANDQGQHECDTAAALGLES